MKKVSSNVKGPTLLCQMKENGMSFNSSVMHLLFQLFSVDFWKQKKCTNKLLVLQDFHRHCWN
ncbi:hypothetical protein R3W88_024792 [Solanum pinnatisectum]|uniref:Uncharacterized protein n=1 Tax=Solanum pinnatisectum TaxID=50273 RepID=A0AAV9M3E0_9SOLN|nr:hypothetical protein R3W88_024792 [Solanum pinnatisectum]